MNGVYEKKAFKQHRLTLGEKKENYNYLRDAYGTLTPPRPEDTLISDGNPATIRRFVSDDINLDLIVGDKLELDEVFYLVKTVRRIEARSLSRVLAIVTNV